jgi:hypothetical protein
MLPRESPMPNPPVLARTSLTTRCFGTTDFAPDDAEAAAGGVVFRFEGDFAGAAAGLIGTASVGATGEVGAGPASDTVSVTSFPTFFNTATRSACVRPRASHPLTATIA